MKALIVRFIRETTGQDLIEYALLGATVSLAATAGMTALGSALDTKFTNYGTSVTNAS
jgi:pilus assembly protein Flp/PilA